MEPKMDASVITSEAVFDPNHHTIISLGGLLAGDEGCASLLKKDFEKKGWAIIQLPSTGPEEFPVKQMSRHGKSENYNLIAAQNKLLQSSKEFFSGTVEQKSTLVVSPTIGYSATPHKESVHVLTSRKAPWEYIPLEPLWRSAFARALQEACAQLDVLVLDLIDRIATPLFGCTKATLAHRADLPVAFSRAQVGMMDVAHYFNTNSVEVTPPIGFSTNEVNCVPHFDPGLFSISFLSTNDGLQLFDPDLQKWLAGPVNTRKEQVDLGVIWLGDAAVRASGGAFKPGIHRVVFPTEKAASRLTTWYEVCTVEQVNQDIEPKPIEGGTVVELPNLPQSKPLQVDQNKNVIQAIARYYGIPRSKIMRKTDMFSVSYSTDFNRAEHAKKEAEKMKKITEEATKALVESGILEKLSK